MAAPQTHYPAYQQHSCSHQPNIVSVPNEYFPPEEDEDEEDMSQQYEEDSKTEEEPKKPI